MDWLQLRVYTQRPQVEQVEDALLAAGAVSVTLEDNADQPILEPALGEMPLWNETRVTGLFTGDTDTAASGELFTAALEDAGSALQWQWEILEDRDWEREWMSHYQPIHCGGKLWICPSWTPPPVADAVNLMLDPGLAFGTGTHPTTFLCLQWLAEQKLGGMRVLDYGCGSGILALAALLLGAEAATGVDIDPQALVATRDNCQRNQLSDEAVALYFPDSLPTGQFDHVYANILAGPLVELAPKLATTTRAGGLLCLSGILAPQAEAVRSAYAPWFDFQQDGIKDGWVRLCAQRNSKIVDNNAN